MTAQARFQTLGEFARRGFTLEHTDDHLLFLLHENDHVAVFSQLGATPRSLQEECARHLRHDWDGCLWQKETSHGN